MTVLIGVTGKRRGALPEWPAGWYALAADVHVAAYSTAVAAAGGVPVQLPRDADPGALVERVDGLVLTGGDDVDPRRYGQVPTDASTAVDPDRDAFELALLAAARTASLPVLGICRGAQLLNVACGGTLVADLPTGTGEAHGFLGYPPGARVHDVRTAEASMAAGVLGSRVPVNSFHHQAVAEPGHGLRPSAWAPDGVVEAIEDDTGLTLGVQWHPELLEQPDPVFGWLVEQAKHRAGTWREGEREVAAHETT